MLNYRMEWAAARSRAFGVTSAQTTTGIAMPVAALGGVGAGVRKPAADARKRAQGDLSAWSPPV